jgi:phospholipid/cholesterol/gamma-HCH transport system permease protein
MPEITEKPPPAVLPQDAERQPSPASRRTKTRRPVLALPSAPTMVVEAGGMLHLALLSTARAVRGPYSYGPELIEQFRFALKLSLIPLVITSFAISFGPVGIQAVNFLGLFGALDRLGGLYVLIVVREFAPLVTAIVVAGVAGTAICADLGARRVREELDALSVLGIDPVKSLVVPRLLAIVLVCVLCDVFALLAGVLGALAVIIQNDAPLGPFFSAFFSTATPLELAASFGKCIVYGVTIAVVSCYKGLNAKGGAEGVGRAVNQAVVITFLMIGVIDYAFTQYLLATNPILSEVR